jgi:hypothetical protein
MRDDQQFSEGFMNSRNPILIAKAAGNQDLKL